MRSHAAGQPETRRLGGAAAAAGVVAAAVAAAAAVGGGEVRWGGVRMTGEKGGGGVDQGTVRRQKMSSDVWKSRRQGQRRTV